jgi:hypothetical protein
MRRIIATSTRLLVGFAGVSIEDHRDAALAHRLLGSRLLLTASLTPSANPTAATPMIEEGFRKQGFGASVERLRVQHGSRPA